MTSLFISDLHLDPNNSSLTDLTVDFLAEKTRNIQSLYILGDLFNAWLGDDIIPIEFAPIIKQLQQCHQAGIKLYLMVGNRDFMMGQAFAQKIGAILLEDSYVFDLYGQKTLLLHGDTLCIDDVSYQKYRRWTRNTLLQWCFRHLPIRYRQHIANTIKQKSHQQKQYKSAQIMDVNHEEVLHVMQHFNVTQLIHGHTHRPAIHQLKINHTQARRIVLGDWHKDISYLKYTAQECQLIDPRITQKIPALIA